MLSFESVEEKILRRDFIGAREEYQNLVGCTKDEAHQAIASWTDVAKRNSNKIVRKGIVEVNGKPD